MFGRAVTGIFLVLLLLTACAQPPEPEAATPSPEAPAPTPVPHETPEPSPGVENQGAAIPMPPGRPGALYSGPDRIPDWMVTFPGYEEALSLVNPVPGSTASASRGKQLYTGLCLPCHAEDGRGREVVGYARKIAARDLTRPDLYRYGISDQALYRTIRYGIPNGPMGTSAEILTQGQTWDLVNYTRQLQRP